MTFADFKTYFQANQNHYANLAWDDPHQLSPTELRVVRTSLQTFQRGESSEGHYLYARAKQLNDPEYTACSSRKSKPTRRCWGALWTSKALRG
jgi:hypothetical protein